MIDYEDSRMSRLLGYGSDGRHGGGLVCSLYAELLTRSREDFAAS